MRNGGGHAKGASWERYCCKRLSLWVTAGKRDDCFWRTAMSGGRATFQLRKDIINRAQAGDMTAISPEGIDLCERYVWEYKHRADLNFDAFITGCGGLLTSYWIATRKLGERIDKLPILIAKQNRYPAVLVSPIGCGLFTTTPWAVFPVLGAELRDFEIVTAVHRAKIQRPRASSHETAPQTLHDERPAFFNSNRRAKAG